MIKFIQNLGMSFFTSAMIFISYLIQELMIYLPQVSQELDQNNICPKTVYVIIRKIYLSIYIYIHTYNISIKSLMKPQQSFVVPQTPC